MLSEYLLIGLLACTTTLASAPALRWVAIRFGIVATVRDRDIHTAPTPYLGGVAIYAGVVTAYLCANHVGRIADERSQSLADTRTVLLSAGFLMLLGCVALPEGPVRYEAATGADHHHLVCRACGRIVNLPATTGVLPGEVAARSGFEIGYAETVHVGLCRTCRTVS